MSYLSDLIKKTEKLRVLYAEDEDHLRDETARFLSRFFSFLHTCSNGQEAWDELQKNNFDIVITDLRMPVMGGIELIKKIQNDYSQTITIALSGISDSDEKELIVDYRLCKPINIQEFSTTLESILERKNQEL